MGRLIYSSILLCSVMLFFACSKDKDPLPRESIDVYVAGYAYDGTTSRAKYWKNGTDVSLTDGIRNAQVQAKIGRAHV